jgi:tetratricopeptide (TPR) repeat protein
LAAAYLAYAFGRRLFHDDRLALLTAVLFGLHPTMVESTTWIGSSCVDGLGAIFFFASLISFLKWQQSESGRWQAASVALFACAMFTKETMVFVPIPIASYLWLTIPGARRISRILRTLLPYGAVWVVYMAIRHEVIKPPTTTAEYVHPTLTLSYLWTAPYATWWYIRHLVKPWGLSVEYAPNVLDRPTLFGFVLPGIGLLLLLAFSWWVWRRRRSPIAAFLIFWFALTLAPPVILAPMVSEHDRYLYIPSYAFCALVAWAVLYLGKAGAKVRLVAALAIVALWSGLTWHEMGYWDCDKTLWGRVLEISPSQQKAQVQLALIYSGELKDFPKALGILDEGLRYHPNSLKIWLVRADILYKDKQFDKARSSYLKVMQLTEPSAGRPVEVGPATSLRASAAMQLALLDISVNNFVEAERYVRMAISLNPDGVGYHSILSRVLAGEGFAEEAKAEDVLELSMRLAQHRNRGLSAHP